MWWLVGFSISQGFNSDYLISQSYSESINQSIDHTKWVFLFTFNNAATTIVSGAATSRMRFSTYMMSCISISGFVFPLISWFQWGDGFLGLKGLGVIDFAGGTVVHVVGGTSALMAAWIVGPRLGRFTQDPAGKWIDNRESGHSIVYATIGVFLLAIGWMGFNSGSTMALTNNQSNVAALAAVNSLVAMSAGGITITLHFIYTTQVHDLWQLLNGLLCGLVAITPGCATVPSWAALIIGCTSVYAYLLGTKLLSRFRIDDVVDAFPVHGMCGTWGTLCVGLFSRQDLIDAAFGKGTINFSVGRQLGVQLLACVVSFAIAGSVQAALFLTLKHTRGVRVSEGDEKAGLDLGYHGGYAYANLNERVKRAHEQMALEAEIANQVRKEVKQGRGHKLKEAINSTAFLPSDQQPNRHVREKSTMSSVSNDFLKTGSAGGRSANLQGTTSGVGRALHSTNSFGPNSFANNAVSPLPSPFTKRPASSEMSPRAANDLRSPASIDVRSTGSPEPHNRRSGSKLAVTRSANVNVKTSNDVNNQSNDQPDLR